MTNKEMTEIFSVMLLAWPNAETFKRGTENLATTIKLWTFFAAEVDFWTGQQAIIRLCKTCKFPPSIAEFLEQVKGIEQDIKLLTDNTFMLIRDAGSKQSNAIDFYAKFPIGSFEREVIDMVGGPGALIITYEHKGSKTEVWNRDGIEQACHAVIKRRQSLVVDKVQALARDKNLRERI